jgi:hypothetical protein
MLETGIPGTSSERPAPPPADTVWVESDGGYRIGVLRKRNALVIEPTDYHCGYLVMDRKAFDKFLGRSRPWWQFL